jgi:hypothetical protein
MRNLFVATCIALAAGSAWGQQKPLVVGVDGT